MHATKYFWLSNNPLILRYWEQSEIDIGEYLPETKVYRLAHYYWHLSADDIIAYQLRSLALRPQHRYVHLINEQWLALELQARGIPAIHCSQNAFLDERIFDVHPDTPKRFDAIYNARMEPFKRHQLACEIKAPYILGGLLTPFDSPEYFAQVRETMPHATFSHADTPVRWFDAHEVAALIRQARVGLCLSACEGAMYAAVEYLLCGLPVVSTTSLGGRDEWFDTRYVRIVPDNPAAVAQAVNELVRLNLDPNFIRQETLKKTWPHRRRLVNLVQDIYDAEGTSRDFAREFYPRFLNKMSHWRPVDQIIPAIERDCRHTPTH